VRVALDNLHQQPGELHNVSRDEAARGRLREVSGAETAPCLVMDGDVVLESPAIIVRLADCICRLR
jgi:glutathione S-transferase